VAETPEQLYARVAGALRMPPVEEWETFPFDGEMTPRPLLAPIDAEQPRYGAGGVDCFRCGLTDDDCVWTNERWLLHAPMETPGLPMIVLLAPREHYAELGDLPEAMAGELVALLSRVERAVYSVGDIGRVHVCKWGDGSEHMHWWFIARPARIPQLIGSFAAIWNDVLPPLPQNVWQENLAAVRAALDGGSV
jgi:diadenosine tetraphosphate (Ap4A) HIT family hydrolase